MAERIAALAIISRSSGIRVTISGTLPRCQGFLEIGQQTLHPRFVARVSADPQEGAVVLERLGDILLPAGPKIGERKANASVTRIERRRLGELVSRLGFVLLLQGDQPDREMGLA